MSPPLNRRQRSSQSLCHLVDWDRRQMSASLWNLTSQSSEVPVLIPTGSSGLLKIPHFCNCPENTREFVCSAHTASDTEQHSVNLAIWKRAGVKGTGQRPRARPLQSASLLITPFQESPLPPVLSTTSQTQRPCSSFFELQSCPAAT